MAMLWEIFEPRPIVLLLVNEEKSKGWRIFLPRADSADTNLLSLLSGTLSS